MSIEEARRFATWLLADKPADIPDLDADGEEVYREVWLFLDRLTGKDTPAERFVELMIMKARRLEFYFQIADWEAMIREALENSSPIEFTVWELEKPIEAHTQEIKEFVSSCYLSNRSRDACALEYEDAVQLCLFDYENQAENYHRKFPMLSQNQKEGSGWVPIYRLGLSCLVGGNARDILKHTLPRDILETDVLF